MLTGFGVKRIGSIILLRDAATMMLTHAVFSNLTVLLFGNV